MEKDAEKAKKIVSMLLGATHHPSTLQAYFESILSQARSEGYEKGREDEHTHHEHLIRFANKQGWNEAIDAAAKVAGERKYEECWCSEVIADKIKELRK